VRLIGVKLSNLRNQHEVKRDKHLTEFFKAGVSKDEYIKQTQAQLNQARNINK